MWIAWIVLFHTLVSCVDGLISTKLRHCHVLPTMPYIQTKTFMFRKDLVLYSQKVSLDKPLVSVPFNHFQGLHDRHIRCIGTFAIAIWFCIYTLLRNKMNNMSVNFVHDHGDENYLAKLFKYWITLGSTMKTSFLGPFKEPLSTLKLNEWRPCKFIRADKIDVNYSKCRFALPHNVVIDVDVGQEVILCLVSASGRVLKKNSFITCHSSLRDLGYFEVFIQNELSGGDENDFDSALLNMETGSKLAVKKGPKRLRLPEIDGVVRKIAVVANRMAAVPALQLLHAVLEDPESSVETVEMLWINNHKREFMLNNEVEQLQRLYGANKLKVTRAVDGDVHNGDTLLNPELSQAFATHQEGSIALVMAEDVVAHKSAQLLRRAGYPENAIATLA